MYAVMYRNIVLICLDTVRKDYFEKHAIRLKNISDVSFEQCRAASSWSVPSHASMITGQHPHQHGVHTHNRDFSILDREQTLFGNLPEEYHTVGISANVYAGPAHNFDAFFDTFVDVPRYQYFTEGLNATEYIHKSDSTGLSLYSGYLSEVLDHKKPIKSLINGAMAQAKQFSMGKRVPDPMDDGAKVASREAIKLVDDTDQPVFLFMNLMEAHEPYSHFHGIDQSLHSAPLSWVHTARDYWDIVSCPEDYSKHIRLLRELYAANIDYLDRIVANLITKIQQCTCRETTIIITADHGENLVFPYEDHLLGHKSSLSESVLHVPLEIVNPPDGYASKESEYVSHLQLPELIQGLARGFCADVFSKRIAAELIGLSGGPEPPSDREHWDRMMRCVYDNTRKVIWDSFGHVSAYNLDVSRPCWQTKSDSGDGVPTWAQEFFDSENSKYKQCALENEQHQTVDSATQQRLADLGYM
jgi:arylsulfatase A-like enzyme